MHKPQTEAASRSFANCQTISEIVDIWAELHPDRPAITFLDESDNEKVTTYSELNLKARAVAAALLKRCRPGDRALVIFPSGPEFVAAYLGCLYAGVLAVPVTEPKPRRPNNRLAAVAKDCGASLLLCVQEVMERVDLSQFCPNIEVLSFAVASAEASDSVELPWIEGDAIAFLQYTSGSTSEPKGVMVSHSNLLHNLETIRQGFRQQFHVDGDEIASGVFWLPSHHDMGLIGGILTPLYIGGHTILMSPNSFLKRPIRWLEAISRFRATISGSPNFAYDFCVDQIPSSDIASLDLSCWEIAFCGAEPIRAKTIDRFCDKFGEVGFQRSSFYPCYGLAESTLLVSGNPNRCEPVLKQVDRVSLSQHQVIPSDSSAENNSAVLVGCGEPLLKGQVAIVDPQTGHRCGKNEIGEIWVASPSVARGYWQQPDASEMTFRATLKDAPDAGQFLRTGDMGFLSEEGQLFISGRLKELLIIRGRNHYPQDIETTASQSHESLPNGSSVAFSITIDDEEELVILHELDRSNKNGDFNELLRGIRSAVIDTHGVEPTEILLVRPFSIPRTTSGKLQRLLSKQLHLDKQLKVMASWQKPRRAKVVAKEVAATTPVATEPRTSNTPPENVEHIAEEIEQWLLNWFVENGGVSREDATPDRPLAELGLDSLQTVELAIEVEERLKLSFNPIVVWNYPTTQELARFLAQQVADEFTSPQPTTRRQSGGARFESLLSEVESMSENDVLRRLSVITTGNVPRPGSDR